MSKAKSGKSEMKNYRFCYEMAFVMYCQKLRVAKVRCQILEWHKQSWQKLGWQKQNFPYHYAAFLIFNSDYLFVEYEVWI